MNRNFFVKRLALLGVFLLAVLAWSTEPAAAQAKPKLPAASAIQIEPTNGGDSGIPKEFCYAVYEHLWEQLHKSGTFSKVLRSGDRDAAAIADLVTVRTTVQKFKEGSQFQRETIKVMGATKIDVTVTVAAKDGHTLLEKPVTGKVRFFGDNLRATQDLAKEIAKLLQQNFAASGTLASASTK